jgi:sugar O-acyltransferase (sialic acid O-acetyltransferase NeuD family)
MTNLIIVGSGAVAAELCSCINDINKFGDEKINIIGFLDKQKKIFDENSIKYKFTQPFLGTFDEFEFIENYKYILGFANIQGRLNFINKFSHKKLDYYTIIHPSSIISNTAKIGSGNVIYPNCVIGPAAIIGSHNLITSYSFISHDCKVGSNNFFSTCGLAGSVNVGDNNYFGIRATILPNIIVGSDNLIQAGMIVDKNITDSETVFYKYKENVRIISKNE